MDGVIRSMTFAIVDGVGEEGVCLRVVGPDGMLDGYGRCIVLFRWS